MCLFGLTMLFSAKKPDFSKKNPIYGRVYKLILSFAGSIDDSVISIFIRHTMLTHSL